RRFGLQQAPRPTHRAGSAPRSAHDVLFARLHSGRWPDELCWRHDQCLSSGRRLYRPDSQGRKAGESAGSAGGKSRGRDQSQDCQGARHHVPEHAPRPRRRGDRMMRRREFFTLIGGAAAWPLAARAQQASLPVVALLSSGRLPESLIGIFRQGLAEQGYIEGRNVVIDYRHGDNQYERLAGLATEFAHRQVAVIAALNSPPALAARAATTTIPIVFMIPDDPVKLGLAVSLSRPGGNATGVSFLLGDLGPKQLGLLRELMPLAKRIGLMVNPHNANFEASK